MVKELRKIILTKDELIEALDSYKRTNFEFLPAGKILDCTLKADSPVIVGLETMVANSIQRKEFKIQPPSLLEPLIHYCIGNHIMLPRNSRKAPLIGDDQAVLFIQINATDAM